MARKRLQQPATRLPRLRLDQGMSRRALAHAAGLSESGLRHIEINGGVPHPEHQLAIATVLGVATTDLWPLVEEDDEEELAA